MYAHAINKQSFDINCNSEEVAKKVQVEIEHYMALRVNGIIDSVLTSLIPGDTNLKLGKVEIDLGDIDISEFGDPAMLEKFKLIFSEKINDATNNITVSNEVDTAIIKGSLHNNHHIINEWELISSLLLNGDLPWWADKTNELQFDVMLRKVIALLPGSVKEFLQENKNRLDVLWRLNDQLKPATRAMVNTLIPGILPESINRKIFHIETGDTANDVAMPTVLLARFSSFLKKQPIDSIDRLRFNLLKKLREIIETLQSKRLLFNTDLPGIVSLTPDSFNVSGNRLGKKARENLAKLVQRLSLFEMEFLLFQLTMFTTANSELVPVTYPAAYFDSSDSNVFLNDNIQKFEPAAAVSEGINNFIENEIDQKVQGVHANNRETNYLVTVESDNSTDVLNGRTIHADLHKNAVAVNNQQAPPDNVNQLSDLDTASIIPQALTTFSNENATNTLHTSKLNNALQYDALFSNNDNIYNNIPGQTSTVATQLSTGGTVKEEITFDPPFDKQLRQPQVKHKTGKGPFARIAEILARLSGQADPSPQNLIRLYDESEGVNIPVNKLVDSGNEHNIAGRGLAADELMNPEIVKSTSDNKTGATGNAVNLQSPRHESKDHITPAGGNMQPVLPGINEVNNSFSKDDISNTSYENVHDNSKEINSLQPGYTKNDGVLKKSSLQNIPQHDTPHNLNAPADLSPLYKLTDNADKSPGIAESSRQRKVAFIMMMLNSSDPSLGYYLGNLDTADLEKLEKVFKHHKLGNDTKRQTIKSISEHPHLLKFEILKIYAHHYLPKEQEIKNLDEPGIKLTNRKKDLLQIFSKKHQLSRSGFLFVIDKLSLKEIIILNDVFQKKAADSGEEKKIIRKILANLGQEAILFIRFLTGLPEHEIKKLIPGENKFTAGAEEDRPRLAQENGITANLFPKRESGVDYTTDGQRKLIIENAGLCLIAIYMRGLFNRLGYLEKGSFKTRAMAVRALYTIHYLVSGKKTGPEYLLQFNKILCGFRIDDHVIPGIRLTKNEVTEADNLLQSVIDNWKALKNTSIDGFRESFLQRKGILQETGSYWTLQVERKGYDLLLNTIPWGFGIIKLPWMKKHIQVEW